jgi:hypothetical protein
MLLIFWLVGGAVLALLLLLSRVRIRVRVELEGKSARYEIRAGILRDSLGLKWSRQDSSHEVFLTFGPIGLPFRMRKAESAGERKPDDKHGLPRSLRRWKSSAGLLMKASSRIRWENLNVRCRLGLPDPAWTGVIFGIVSCLGILPGRFSMDLTPDFEQPGLSGSVTASVSFLPVVLLGEYIRFQANVKST